MIRILFNSPRFLIPFLLISGFDAGSILAFESVDFSGHNGKVYSSQWESFTQAVGAPGNLPDVEGSDQVATISQSAFGASVTGSGNIYNPAGASEFSLAFQTGGPVSRIVLQVRSIGELSADVELVPRGYDQVWNPEAREISRVSGGFGDIVTMHYTWSVTNTLASSGEIRFSAASSHLSLDSVKLDILSADVIESWDVEIDAPDQDQWVYTFNMTPGNRGAASLFRTPEDDGIYFGGNYALVFRIENPAPVDRVQNVRIQSAVLEVMTSSNFNVPYDPTYDSVFTSLPDDREGAVEDSDPGRPVELFAALFNNELTAESWLETMPVSSGEPRVRAVIPARFNASGDLTDASLAVSFADPQEYSPLAIGNLSDGTEPGEGIPEGTWMTFNLDTDDPHIQKYLQDALQSGHLAFMLASLNQGGQGDRSYPEFYTKDSLLGEAPRLKLVFAEYAVSVDSVPHIANLSISDRGATLEIVNVVNPENLAIHWSENLKDWNSVENPQYEFLSDNVVRWVDPDITQSIRFFRVSESQ